MDLTYHSTTTDTVAFQTSTVVVGMMTDRNSFAFDALVDLALLQERDFKLNLQRNGSFWESATVDMNGGREAWVLANTDKTLGVPPSDHRSEQCKRFH
ncbi:hypothetical protein GCM10007385_46380 [Tateyamaria omphalii]|nr:hypothetical protein GCM10007385_46380 [Tateyamaria omphalii]